MPKDFPQQRVALTAGRAYRLVESGELDNWAARLGHEPSPADTADGGPADWTPEQWKRSEYYADQIQRWLYPGATPEDVSRKWDGIRLALRGVLDPGFDRDPEIPNNTLVHPYFTLHTDHDVPPAEADLLVRAYAAAPEERGAAVVAALKALCGDPGLRERSAAGTSCSSSSVRPSWLTFASQSPASSQRAAGRRAVAVATERHGQTQRAESASSSGSRRYRDRRSRPTISAAICRLSPSSAEC
ncbi:hypothetical protein [Nonomuraea sp. NPDC048916]|uniref:hypothetical protein n=1 Tax=Nonomuraea sp. NPDC048916 TaxID=3154232 RepID=UPI0033F19DE4